MDKSSQSSEDSGGGGGADGTSGGRDQYLRHLNKFSHKISKPAVKKPFSDDPLDQNHNFRPPAAAAPQNLTSQNQNQHQPPVYNINKSDFRDVVQKLTGSPAHERLPAPPPPIHAPKPQSTRLQRIRPPPLAHVSNRPPPVLTGAAGPGFGSFSRPAAPPLSPLPPLPSVHAAAESPVSAYMRFLHNSGSNLDQNPKQFPGFSFSLSPLAPPPAPPPMGLPPAAPPAQFQLPSSPLPFGCSNSPKSQYPLLSPSSSSFPQFPLSPRVPLSSPRWRDL